MVFGPSVAARRRLRVVLCLDPETGIALTQQNFLHASLLDKQMQISAWQQLYCCGMLLLQHLSKHIQAARLMLFLDPVQALPP